ncbi:MAG: GIY-YIG nuclease family protein [Gemmatimonadetes bacterium]|nr:GIY-YIG nuclease family protein [Gemmatimonadota bacterium]
MESQPSPRAHTRPPVTPPAHRKQLRALVRTGCENRPGVYRMLGPTGTVLYVGQSKRLRTRLLSYFRAKGRRNKAARIVRHAFTIEWEYTPTAFGALLRELRLIKQYRPHFNAVFVGDEWPRAYVALTGGAIPGLRVVDRSDYPGATALFGPFRRVAQLRDAVRALADATGVRDCSLDGDALATASRARAPGCLRDAVGSCPGPCLGPIDRTAYDTTVRELHDFLEGLGDAPVQRLTQAMHAAANDLAFERAGVLRDRLALVQWLHARVQQFRANVDRLTFRYTAPTVDGGQWVYLIRRGTVRADCAAPSSAEDAAALAALEAQVFGGPRQAAERGVIDLPTHDLDEFALVASWFRRHAAERARLSRPGPYASETDGPESETARRIAPDTPLRYHRTLASGPAPGLAQQ